MPVVIAVVVGALAVFTVNFFLLRAVVVIVVDADAAAAIGGDDDNGDDGATMATMRGAGCSCCWRSGGASAMMRQDATPTPTGPPKYIVAAQAIVEGRHGTNGRFASTTS